MQAFITYLNFNGRTEEAFTFYQSVFGGEITCIQRLNDIKNFPGISFLSEKDRNAILHISLRMHNGAMLMGNDIIESLGQKLIIGNNVCISVYADSKEEAKSYFTLLAKGGKVLVPSDPFNHFHFSCMLKDRFGVQWMIACNNIQ